MSNNDDSTVPLAAKSEKVLMENDHAFEFEERVGDSRQCKEYGADAHKAKDFKRAIELYERALYHAEFDNLTWEHEFEEHHRNTVRQVRLPIYLNLAACFLAQDDAQRARDNCDLALKIDSNNVKALYRKGQALLILDDPEEASKLLKKAAEFNPQDKAIRQAWNKCKEKLQVLRQEQKKRLGGFLVGKDIAEDN
ncbi:hypothetical protein AC1031_007109 [Aphanomyces cochlioides]|nr:hypothetical protein AC1031_007109 [Aphanomyces cochlioides]